MRISDWSSDVCSSDLGTDPQPYRRECRCNPARVAVGLHWRIASSACRCPDRRRSHVLRRIETCAVSRVDFGRSEEHTSELQSLMAHLVCRLLLEKKKQK